LNRPVDRETIRDTLEKTDALLKRADERIGSRDASARAIYNRAATRQREAWQSFERGELRKSLALTRVARNLAREALAQINDAD